MKGPAVGPLARLLPYALAFFSSLCIMILELVASRLVARHVGASLMVWTSVIGIMLGGICLGNVLGGRLADRLDPVRALGPLFALGSALALASIWINAVVGLLPGLDALPWELRTVLVVSLDFLVPGTVLGMIGPLVAKMAVEQSLRSGSALGDVYSLGAVGSIAGTFLAGFVLIYAAPTSTIVLLVSAALALLAAALLADPVGSALGLLTCLGLALGSVESIAGKLRAPGIVVGSVRMNAFTLAGTGLAALLAVWGAFRLAKAREARRELEQISSGVEVVPDGLEDEPPPFGKEEPEAARASLADLSALAFLASLAFMAFEMDAGRLVQRHLGSSVYGWTSIIGVLLAGLSIGNWLGGRLANKIRGESQASWLFLAASILILTVLAAEQPTPWLARHTGDPFPAEPSSILGRPATESMAGWAWPTRVLLIVAAVFLPAAIALGTVSPVVAKLAVDRVRRSGRTGRAIGQVYAWGMVGSIAGTFLAGFLLIDLLGTKGLILALATVLALAATGLGTVWHAAWAGIPLGLCVIAFVPLPWFQNQGVSWGIREKAGDPETVEEGNAYIDESDYYYIKIENEDAPEGQKRTLVLDNLIHGYIVRGRPDLLLYDYEHIYGLVTDRIAKRRSALAAEAEKPGGEASAPAGAKPSPPPEPLRTMFLGGGSYTFPRYLQHTYPGTQADVAEIDPAVTRANLIALDLSPKTPIQTTWGDARQFVARNRGIAKYDLIFGDAFNDFSVPWHLTTREFNEMLASMLGPEGVYMINIIDLYESVDEAERRGRREAQEAARDRARDAAKANGADADEVRRAGLDSEPTRAEVNQAIARARAEALNCGAFLGAWVNTARLTFPHVYVFGTNASPGEGGRETFVVVASKVALDLQDLARRPDDPRFTTEAGDLSEPDPYPQADLDALEVRSRGIVLTDDYAPVEDLLAPVAATRAED